MESPYFTQSRDFSIMWHPSVTSTPIVPSYNQNLGKLKSSQKQLIKPVDVAKAFLGNEINQSLLSLKEKKKNTRAKKSIKASNKKSTYFEVSSSDDEDCLDKVTLPGVKITFGKNANHRFMLDNKPHKKTLQEESTGNSINNSLKKDFETKDCLIENKVRSSKNNNNVTKFIKKKITGESNDVLLQQHVNSEKTNNNFIIKNKKKLDCTIAKENIVLHNNNKFSDKIHIIKNKNNSEIPGSFTTNNVLDNKIFIDKNEVPDCTKLSGKSSVLKEKNEEIKGPKSFQNLKKQTSRIPVQVSKKIKENCINPARNKPTKTGGKKLCVNKANSSLSIRSKKKKNLSHQLFSDTKEQELIDSLDLTVMEPDEMCTSPLVLEKNQSEAHFKQTGPAKAQTKQTSPAEVPTKQTSPAKAPTKQTSPAKAPTKQSSPAKAPTKQTSSNTEFQTDASEYTNTKRILRQRKSPKKYWLPVSAVDSAKVTEQSNVKKTNQQPGNQTITKNKKNLTQDQVEHKNQGIEEKIENSQKNTKPNKVVDEKVNNSIVKIGQDQKALIDVKNDAENMEVKQKRGKKRKSPEVMKSTTSKTRRLAEKEEEKKDPYSIASDQKKYKNNFLATNIPESSSSGVFQKLVESSFTENKPGCFASEFRALKGFKCGVLKVCGNSEISCKTAHKYSYFGGVLIKNKLKMTIGVDKVELEEGDMAFVPPLTEWSAVNETELESIFYYWCCKLKC